MSTQTTIPGRSKVLPNEVKQYLLSDETFNAYELLLREYGLEQDKAISVLSSMMYGLLEGKETIEEARENMALQLGLTKEQSVSFMIMLFARSLHPVASFVPQFMERVEQWTHANALTKQKIAKPEFVRLFLLSFTRDMDAQSSHRLGLILLAYLAGERSRQDTVLFLERPPKLGGLELDSKTSEQIIKSFDQRREAVVIDEEQKAVEKKPEPISQEPEPVPEPVLSFQPAVSVEQTVSLICSNPSFVFSDLPLQKRCANIVAARVRDVRDASQTRELFERDIQEGGLGVHGRQLADMVEIVERFVDGEKNKAKERMEMERTKKKQEKSDRVDAFTQKHTQMVRDAVVKSSVKSEPIVPTARPKVQDVVRAPRLVGPVDELRSLGLMEFRRVSKDAKQAAARIKDIVLLLEEQSFGKRVEGITAFRSSALMRAYSEVTNKAIVKGKTIEEILAMDPKGLRKDEYDALLTLNDELRF